MGGAVEALMLIAAVPLLILNMLGGLVGGVGLAFQGEWLLLIGGIGWAVVGPYLLSVALLPSLVFAPLAASLERRSQVMLPILAALPALIWTYFVVTVSCIVVFQAVVSRPEAGFFHFLWAYSTATAPWSFMANKDKQSGDDKSTILMFFVQLGLVSMMVATWADPAAATYEQLAPWFLPFMGVGVIAQIFVILVEAKNLRHRGY